MIINRASRAADLRLRDQLAEVQERVLDVLARLRGRQEGAAPQDRGHLRDLRLAVLDLRLEVGLVRREDDRDLARDFLDRLDPARQYGEGLAPRQVGDGED